MIDLIWLNSLDYRPIFYAASVAGIFLSIAVMQLFWNGYLGDPGCFVVRHARRFGLFLVSIAMGLSFIYVFNKDWQPHPPGVLLVVAIDILQCVALLDAYIRHRNAKAKEARRLPAAHQPR